MKATELDKQIDILAAKLRDLNEAKNKATRLKCFHKCESCKKRRHLSKWSKMNSYHFQDDVYTQNMVLSDILTLICPYCERRSWAQKELGEWDRLEDKKDLLDLYDKMRSFENAGGKFAKYYTDYDGNSHRGYYVVPPYSGIYNSEQTYKNLTTEPPFKY